MNKVINAIIILLFILAYCSCLIFLVQEINSKSQNYLDIALILVFAFTGFSVGLWIRNYGLESLVKSILPATISITTAIWLISSGYLNLQKANLEFEIGVFQKEKKIVQDSIINLNNTKTLLLNNIIQLKDSISIYRLDSLRMLKKVSDLSVIQEKYIRDSIFISKYYSRLKDLKEPIVELLNLDLKKGNYVVKLHIFDSRLNKLSQNDICILSYGQEIVGASKGSKNSYLFEIDPEQPYGANNDDINPNFDGTGYLDKTWPIRIIKANKPYYTLSDYREDLIAVVKVPYGRAEYNIILNNYLR